MSRPIFCLLFPSCRQPCLIRCHKHVTPPTVRSLLHNSRISLSWRSWLSVSHERYAEIRNRRLSGMRRFGMASLPSSRLVLASSLRQACSHHAKKLCGSSNSPPSREPIMRKTVFPMTRQQLVNEKPESSRRLRSHKRPNQKRSRRQRPPRRMMYWILYVYSSAVL